MRTYKFKLYENRKNNYIDYLFGIACEIYNVALKYKRDSWTNQKKNVSRFDLINYIQSIKNLSENEKWKELNSTVIQQICDRITNGYTLFFENCKERKSGTTKRKVNPPKFKKQKNYRSLTYKAGTGFHLVKDENKIRIQNKTFRYYKNQKIEGMIKTTTIKKNNLGEYFIYIVTDHVDVSRKKIQSQQSNSAGFDFGLKTFLVGSNGSKIESPLFFKKNEKKIKKLSRSLSKKKQGSNNKKKALMDLRRLHKKISNCREDFHWKTSIDLCRNYDVICLEDLNLEAMKKRFGKKINDLGFYNFVQKLQYIASKYDVKVIKVGRYFASSKICNDCGEKNLDLQLRDREWVCKSCGVYHDRDLNASKNILDEGLRILKENSTIIPKKKTKKVLKKNSVGASTDKTIRLSDQIRATEVGFSCLKISDC